MALNANAGMRIFWIDPNFWIGDLWIAELYSIIYYCMFLTYIFCPTLICFAMICNFKLIWEPEVSWEPYRPCILPCQTNFLDWQLLFSGLGNLCHFHPCNAQGVLILWLNINCITKVKLHPSCRDAAWESQTNAFQDLLEQHAACDVEECKCPKGKGRNHHKLAT